MKYLFIALLVYGFLRPILARIHQRHMERMEALEWELADQAKEQERLAKEQEKLAKEQARQADRLAKLEMRLATAENEIAFNREQRERLFELLNIEEQARDEAIYGGKEWAKHQRKVISLEAQIHTVQNRLDKAKVEKCFCEERLSV